MTVAEIWERFTFDGRAILVKPKDWESWSKSGIALQVVFPELHRRAAVWIIRHQGQFLLCRDTEGLVGGYPVIGPLDAAEKVSANDLLPWIRAVGNREG